MQKEIKQEIMTVVCKGISTIKRIRKYRKRRVKDNKGNQRITFVKNPSFDYWKSFASRFKYSTYITKKIEIEKE